MTTVCVIGAGIVGCATAYQLALDGLDVVLLDSAGEPGTAASAANGAQLSYSYVQPMASPATLRSLPKMFMSRGSPVRFRLRADWQQWAWGLRFLQACSDSRVLEGTAQLLDLARLSKETLEGWMAREAWQFSFARNGKLVLCPDRETFLQQQEQVRIQAAMGCQQEVLGPSECFAIEPALAREGGMFVGGIWTADECVADAHLLCGELVRSLRRLGGEALFGRAVTSLVACRQNYTAARTDLGDVSADLFVLAAGPQTGRFEVTLGRRLPVYPIRGYSLTVPMRAEHRPRVSVTHLGHKSVFAPLAGNLRVAAMAEIDGYELHVPDDRVEAMISNVEALYPGLCDWSNPRLWAGLRPATPDSIPIIERCRNTNVYLNVGHGALGLTLAAGSARRLSAIITDT